MIIKYCSKPHVFTEAITGYCPVYYFIAISEPSTIIKVIGDQEAIARVVAHAELFSKRIIAANVKMAMEGNAKINRYQIGMKIFY